MVKQFIWEYLFQREVKDVKFLDFWCVCLVEFLGMGLLCFMGWVGVGGQFFSIQCLYCFRSWIFYCSNYYDFKYSKWGLCEFSYQFGIFVNWLYRICVLFFVYNIIDCGCNCRMWFIFGFDFGKFLIRQFWGYSFGFKCYGNISFWGRGCDYFFVGFQYFFICG